MWPHLTRPARTPDSLPPAHAGGDLTCTGAARFSEGCVGTAVTVTAAEAAGSGGGVIQSNGLARPARRVGISTTAT